jgi:hypothetical protein
MDTNQRNSPIDFAEKRQGQGTNFKASIQFEKTVIETENIENQRIVLITNFVWIKDQNGIIRKTVEGDSYKVTIENGQISFDKPLKFQENG